MPSWQPRFLSLLVPTTPDNINKNKLDVVVLPNLTSLRFGLCALLPSSHKLIKGEIFLGRETKRD